jgi:preprotein translocase subunit SecG
MDTLVWVLGLLIVAILVGTVLVMRDRGDR